MGATTIIIGPRLTFWNRSLKPLFVVSSVSQRNFFRNSTRRSTTTTISCGRVTTAIRRLHFAFSRSPSSRRQYSEVSDMGAEAGKKAGVIALFDVDGTLTPARKEASAEMKQFMQDLRKVVTVGVVGGSDLVKISEQLGKTTIFDYDYVFSENGLVAYQDGKLIGTQSLTAHLGEEKLKKFINFVLHYIADLDIPLKRGTFIEFRMGMLNVSPIGRNCSYDERLEFEKYDKVHNIRSKFVDILKEKFADYELTYSIGGQISFDVFPHGWDKTFCLKFIEKEFSEIHFFGDKTFKGGNDYEIFESEKTIGHTVTSPEDTRSQSTQLFL